jgi:hypothetical protein
MDDAVDFVFCLNAVTENATTNFLCLGQNILVCDSSKKMSLGNLEVWYHHFLE